MLSEDQIYQLAEQIVGTCEAIDMFIDRLELEDEITSEELLDRLLTVDVELCVGCEWWHNSYELEWVEERNGGLCDQCLEDHK